MTTNPAKYNLGFTGETSNETFGKNPMYDNKDKPKNFDRNISFESTKPSSILSEVSNLFGRTNDPHTGSIDVQQKQPLPTTTPSINENDTKSGGKRRTKRITKYKKKRHSYKKRRSYKKRHSYKKRR